MEVGDSNTDKMVEVDSRSSRKSIKWYYNADCAFYTRIGNSGIFGAQRPLSPCLSLLRCYRRPKTCVPRYFSTHTSSVRLSLQSASNPYRNFLNTFLNSLHLLTNSLPDPSHLLVSGGAGPDSEFEPESSDSSRRAMNPW
jgi:hypothetical protein